MYYCEDFAKMSMVASRMISDEILFFQDVKMLKASLLLEALRLQTISLVNDRIS